MAWAVSLSHGSTSVDLANASGIKIERDAFRPTVGPDKTETGITTDSYQAFINASTVADLQAFIRSANYAFLTARQRQERNAGDRVYLNVTADGDTTGEWRSEVLDGDCIPNRIISPNWSNGEAWVTLSITRRNWFEGPEATLTLSNLSSTGGTAAGIDVFLNGDQIGVHDNFANINGSQIIGDLPGFGIAQMTLGPESFQRIFTQYGRTADVTDQWIDIGTASDSDVSDATASGLYYKSTAISSGAPGFTGYGGTYVSTNATTMFRIIGRIGFTSGAGTYRVIPTATTARGNDENWATVYVTASDSAMHVYSFGVGQVSNYNTSDVYADLAVYDPLGGNLLADFLQIAPAETVRDYYLSAVSASAGGGVITDDTVLDSLTSTVTGVGGGRTGTNISATGNNKILLYPGINQTIWINGEPWTGGSYVNLILKYRPRRSTL